MRHICRITIFASFLLLGLVISPCLARQTAAEYPAEAKNRLEHIIGKWQSRWEYLDSTGAVVGSITGSEEAKYLIGEQVVEMTTVVPARNSTSKAWMFYNQNEQKFYLTSVDAKGDFWLLTGGLDQYVIVSQPKRQPDGRDMIIRFTHSNIQHDSAEALMEYSFDDGKSWRTGFRQYLTRVE